MPDLPDAKEKSRFVQKGFNEIARRYDLLNDLMTLGRHRRWKDRVIPLAGVGERQAILDLCSGTGDLAGRAAQAAGPEGLVIALDFSLHMIATGRERFSNQTGLCISWMRGDACRLPFQDNVFDGVTVGFGLRNVVSIETALGEAQRVLKPGKRMVSLDTAGTEWKIFSPFYSFYMAAVVPLLGLCFARSRWMYQYLADSAKAFHHPAELCALFEQCGFVQCGYAFCPRRIGGAALVWGEKPGAGDSLPNPPGS